MYYGNNCENYCGHKTNECYPTNNYNPCINNGGCGMGFNWLTDIIWIGIIYNVISQLFCNNGRGCGK